MDQEIIIEFSRVSFSFGQGPPLFQDVSLKVPAGSFCLIQGPSGSGKSTLLRMFNRLEEPSAGQIFFKGHPLLSFHPPRLRRSILFIQQTPTVFDGTIRDNLLRPFTFKNNRDLVRPGEAQLNKILEDFLMEGLDLDDHAQTLSGGQLQRLCFIRGLLLEPEVLLLDEPTSALDHESAEIVESVTRRLIRESGLTVVLVSHKKVDFQDLAPTVFEVTGGRVTGLQ